jgi:hypothetical protein
MAGFEVAGVEAVRRMRFTGDLQKCPAAALSLRISGNSSEPSLQGSSAVAYGHLTAWASMA